MKESGERARGGRWNGYKSRNAECYASFFDRREALYSVVIHRYSLYIPALLVAQVGKVERLCVP